MTNWKRLRTAALALTAGGCATAGSDPADKPCPPLIEYSRAEQTRVVTELDLLETMLAKEGADCVTCMFVDDYGLMRDQCR